MKKLIILGMGIIIMITLVTSLILGYNHYSNLNKVEVNNAKLDIVRPIDCTIDNPCKPIGNKMVKRVDYDEAMQDM